jgi:hypothetical protein
MKDVKIKTTSIPAKPRSKNYPAGAVITRTAGGVTVNGGGGGGASVDIVKATDTKSFTDSNVLSSLRTLLEIRSRIIASSDTATELTDDNTLSSLRILKEIDAAIKEALKKIDDLYLSKVKADIAKEPITFLKGLFVGDGLTFINESGDTELQSLVARMKVKAATLEVTGSANVGTLHSEGNISTGADIWAKGNTHTLNLLVQALAKTYDLNVEHVATLFQTIVKDYISSERFIPGLMGEGMKLYKAINGDWNLEIDNAVVRKAMTIFELIISKVRAVNGGLVISSANGRVKSISETSGDPAYYVLGIEGDMMFVTDDLVRCQVYTSGHVKYYWVPVASVNDDSILILKSVFPNGTTPAVGDDLVQMGNLTNPNRQGILYLTASEDGKPRISVLDGVNSTSLAGKNKVILGCLDGMTDTDFPADLQPSGYGLYAMNCFLKGIFILRNGKSIEQEFSNIATELAAIPGKIELSVKTKVENWGIGANNLYSYTSSTLNTLYPSPTIERQMSLHGFYLVGSQGNGGAMRIPDIIPPIPGKYTVSGWIKGSQNTPVGFTIDVCDSENVIVKSTADNQWSYFKHTFNVTKNTEEQKDVYNFVDIERIDWAYIWVKDFKVEAGEIATAWSPNFQDAVYKGAEYTNSQISVVEGKITSTVEKINTVDGRVTGLASRIEQTEKSITSVVGDISVINSTTNRHISKRIDLRGWDNNKFFPLVISIPVYHKTRVEISRPLNAGYGKPSYGTHDGGFSMNLTFEMSGSGWGSLPAVTNIFDYTKAWTSAGAKIVVDLGQITKTSTCRMGIRGGSMYDVTVDDTIDPNVINVYQTDYHGSYNTSFPVRTDGTEPVRTYGYYTEIKQTQESIALTANKVDDQGRRLSAAELTLSSDHAKLSVVEQTANSANSLAGTANSKANTVDGRVTATQNGLVKTGINITSRKIVLKSDNVLFQNNAGQQTAAINANGKLAANAIEVGEVVAGGFAAQRITTGNLTVTDGAVIGGMTITGGVLTGKNINIQNGAKIGNFTIVSGIFSAQNTPAGIQMTLSNNSATFDSSGVRVEHNSGGYALTTTGNGRVFLTGSNFWVQCKDVDFMGVRTWKAPGVFYACTILGSGAIGKTWGNPDFHITRVVLNSIGRYTVYTSGGQVGNYFVMLQGYDPSLWLSTTVEPYSPGEFTYKVFDVNNGMKNAAVIIYFCGMVS